MFRAIPAGRRCLIRLTATTKTSIANAHAAAPATTHGHHDVFNRKNAYPRIGEREIVGYGRNGEPQYFDAIDCPLPSIRWKADVGEIKALREKAKGDWGNLTIEEKRNVGRFFYF